MSIKIINPVPSNMISHKALWIDMFTLDDLDEFNKWKETFPIDISLETEAYEDYVRDAAGYIEDILHSEEDYIKIPKDIPQKYLSMLLLKWC